MNPCASDRVWTGVATLILWGMGAGCATTSVRPIRSQPHASSPVPEHVHLEISVDPDARVRRITFHEVVDAASEDAPLVLQADARLRRAAAGVDTEVGELLPQVAIGVGVRGTYGREIGNFANQMDDIGYARFRVGVSLFYNLNVGERITALSAARGAHDASEHDARDARLRARRAVAQAYFDLVMGYASLEVFDDLARGAERLAEISRARLETGVGNEVDIARALAARARALSAHARATADRERASTTLAVLLGWDPETRLAPAEGEIPLLDLADQATYSGDRPDVEAARERAEAASSRASSRWWGAFGPEIRAGIEPGWIGIDAADLAPTLGAWAWIGVSIGFGEVGAARAAEAEAELRALERDELEGRARAEVLAASARLRAAHQALPEAWAAVESLERVYRLELARFEEGTSTSFEVIEAQRALAEGRVELARAMLDYDDAQVELSTALGVVPEQR